MRQLPSSVAGARAWTLLRRTCLAGMGFLGACVSAPEPADLLAVGFRTPEQAFRTFQTATRLDDPDLELRCFSVGFRSRNRISQLTWREGRAELYARQPWLRAGIAGAEVTEAEVRDDLARLVIDTAGGDYVVELVREDFAEGWVGDERVLDDAIDWSTAVGIQRGEGGRRWVFGRVALPADVNPDSITDVRFGREWKIDGVGPLEAPEENPPSRAQAQLSLEHD